eukprot:g22532.t1
MLEVGQGAQKMKHEKPKGSYFHMIFSDDRFVGVVQTPAVHRHASALKKPHYHSPPPDKTPRSVQGLLLVLLSTFWRISF